MLIEFFTTQTGRKTWSGTLNWQTMTNADIAKTSENGEIEKLGARG